MTFGFTHPEWCHILAILISRISKVHEARESLWKMKERTFALPIWRNLYKARLWVFSTSMRLRPSIDRIWRKDKFYLSVGDCKGYLRFLFVQIQMFQPSGLCFNSWKFANAIRYHSALDSGFIIVKRFSHRWRCYDSSSLSVVHWHIFILRVHYKYHFLVCYNC
jgi:hypothetical protein